MALYEQDAEYVCTVTQQGFTTSKGGTYGFFLRVKPIGQVIPDDPENTYECAKDERQVTIWITEKTEVRVIGDLRRLGWNGTDFTELDPEVGSHSFVGRNIHCVCKHETSKDGQKTYDKFELPFFGRVIENDKSVAAKLNKAFGKTLKEPVSAPKAQAQKPASKPAPATASVASNSSPRAPIDANAELQEAGVDEDIPF